MNVLKRIRKKKFKLLTGFAIFMTGVSISPHLVLAEDDEVFVSSPFESPDDNSLSDESTSDKEESEENEENEETANPDDTDLDLNKDNPSTDGVENQNLDSDDSEVEETKTDDEASKVEPTESTASPLQGNAGNATSERFLEDQLAKYEGKTIVDIEFEGASEKTLPTVKIVINEHVGDEFTVEAAMRDYNNILRTGYFYDLYPRIEEVPEGIILTYHMLENPILTDIVFEGNTIMKTSDLERSMNLRKGDVLNSERLHDNITALQEKYRGEGYVLMKITDMNIDDNGILTLKINEGILEGYKVKGNKKTKDKVILREMRQKPGEVFNANLARRSMQRVNNLGFFEEVNVKMNPGVEPNAIILEIDVKEKRTGTFGVGAGYSSEDGIIGMVSIADTNFRGVGDAVSIMYEISGDDEDAHGVTFSFRRPWLDSKETAGTFRFYNRTYEYDDYDTRGHLKEEYMRKYTGGEITMSRPVSEYSTNYVTLRNRKDEYVKHVSSGNAGNRSGLAGKDWRRDNFGTTRSVTLEHVTDTRDNIYNPTTGGRVNLSAEFGGWFGGDFDFQKYSIEHQQFFRAGHAQVWALRSKYGIGYGDISEFNQYRIGGQDTLRGYREDQFRGERMLLGTLEYRFPLFPKIQGALFTDWGSAWNSGFKPDEFHGSVGVGVSLTTPLGPLRLDYGRGSQGGRVHFSVGGVF